MKQLSTMAFIRSEKAFEKRLALLPQHMKEIKHVDQLYFEQGYGKDFHIKDEAYEQMGAHVVMKKEALCKDIICDVKLGEATYLEQIADHKILTGWIHAGADKNLTDVLMRKHHTCYAWEDFYEDKRHLFWRNNQIAGAGGVMNALQYTGFFPYGCKAGIIGRGDSASGAFYMLTNLGAQVQQYSRQQEALFIKELPTFDIIVMAIRWDTLRKDHLITALNRKQMKCDAIIIDISDDVDGAIEQSKSSTIQDPIYYLNDIMVYSVCNVPSIYYKTATLGISSVMSAYIDRFVEQKDDLMLRNSIIIQDGQILDTHIAKEQHRSLHKQTNS